MSFSVFAFLCLMACALFGLCFDNADFMGRGFFVRLVYGLTGVCLVGVAHLLVYSYKYGHKKHLPLYNIVIYVSCLLTISFIALIGSFWVGDALMAGFLLVYSSERKLESFDWH